MSPLSAINNPEDPLAEQEKPINLRSTTENEDPFIMVAETISLGILSLPSAVASLGLVA
ncbi:amino acid transporter [Aspergillus luchuensis]|uniref:Amino acid transporter n=1 Tax=Aspergillus kawachii TaxID=1069201 RepID=A0A146FZA4_ASPKA|nr:amino acid transporter [Aspergillus luchuensis]